MDDKIARIVKPENKLKKKIGTDVNIHDILKPEIIKGAQKVIEEKSDDFLTTAKEDMKLLEQYYAQLKAENGHNPELNKSMNNVAEQLRDRSGTFGYQLGSQVAKSLVHFCEEPHSNFEHFQIVCRKHMDSLQAIYTYNLTGDGGPQGKELIIGLKKLIKMYA